MGARDWVRRLFGEGVAGAIEKVAAAVFGDDNFIDCLACRTPVPANLVTERGCCPACGKASETLACAALLAQREAVLEKGRQGNEELDRIDRLIAVRREKE
jgi:hypothetical protein